MYAVIESGGKQHRVEKGEVLKLEKLEAATGEEVKFDKILLVGEGGVADAALDRQGVFAVGGPPTGEHFVATA